MPVPLAGLLSGILTRIATSFLTRFALAAGFIVSKAVGWFGGQMVVMDFAIDPMKNLIASQFSGAPAMFVQTVSYVEADRAMVMILTAYIVVGSGRMLARFLPGVPSPGAVGGAQ